MSKNLILNQLEKMGFNPCKVADEQYFFRFRKTNYIYIFDEDSEDLLNIVISDIYWVCEGNKQEVYEAIEKTMAIARYAKVLILDSQVVIMYEHMLMSTDNLEILLEHILLTLRYTLLLFSSFICNRKCNSLEFSCEEDCIDEGEIIEDNEIDDVKEDCESDKDNATYVGEEGSESNDEISFAEIVSKLILSVAVEYVNRLDIKD